MIKIIKLFRGIKLILLNSIHFKSKSLGMKLIFFLIVNSLTKFVYLKIKNKKIDDDFFNYLKDFKFSRNYFKHNASIWYEILNKNFFLNKKVNVLEIGTFEGMSFLFFQKYLQLENLYCVDVIENENFKLNKEKFKNYKFFNTSSDDFFKKITDIKFDIIYVDGSHYAKDVYNDIINSYHKLTENGILIIDDFLLDVEFRRNKNYFDEVMAGVFMFFDEKINYKILYTGHQLILKKIKI
tara:strand:- start:111 stop:827 length:717 start_codon:yes stop_codon:yes gene_type:complete